MTEAQRRTIVAAMSCVLPDDETGPGAIEAGTVGFVEAAIANGSCARHVDRVMKGLPLLDECASAMFDRDFASCGEDARHAVLQRLRDAPHPAVLRFLTSLIRLTLMGFLCAPRHGGNRNGCGWEYVGFVPHRRTSSSARAASVVR